MLPRRLLLTTSVALLLFGSACSTSGGGNATATTTTTKTEKTTTTEKSSTTVDRSKAVDAIAAQLTGDTLSSDEANCFAKAYVADASADGIKRAEAGKGDPSDLTSADQKVFISAADGCVQVSDLAGKAAKAAISELGDKIPLTGGEDTCVSANLSQQYDRSGQFLFDISTSDTKTEKLISTAIGACIQTDSLKAVITNEIGNKIPPAVADCVAQSFIDQNGGTAAAFEVLRSAGSGGDTSALESQVTTITQACLASAGGGG